MRCACCTAPDSHICYNFDDHNNCNDDDDDDFSPHDYDDAMIALRIGSKTLPGRSPFERGRHCRNCAAR